MFYVSSSSGSDGFANPSDLWQHIQEIAKEQGLHPCLFTYHQDEDRLCLEEIREAAGLPPIDKVALDEEVARIRFGVASYLQKFGHYSALDSFISPLGFAGEGKKIAQFGANPVLKMVVAIRAADNVLSENPEALPPKLPHHVLHRIGRLDAVKDWKLLQTKSSGDLIHKGVHLWRPHVVFLGRQGD